MEHGAAHRGGDVPVRGHRHRGGLAGGTHRPARPPGLGGTAGHPAGDPRLRRQLRLEQHVVLGAGLPRLGPGHDAGGLPARLPAGRGQPPQRRSGSGGSRAQSRRQPPAHVRPHHAGPGPGRDPGRLPAGRARPAGRVRGVRDARLPHLHHRDLQQSRAAHRRAHRVRAVTGARLAQPAGARRRGQRRRPRPGPDSALGPDDAPAHAAAATRYRDAARRSSALPRWSCSRSGCPSARPST